MHNEAYHRILTADGHTIEGPISVRWDNNGCPISWHRLEQEEASTIWTGNSLSLGMNIDEVQSLYLSKE